jgi:hypothetical protein
LNGSNDPNNIYDSLLKRITFKKREEVDDKHVVKKKKLINLQLNGKPTVKHLRIKSTINNSKHPDIFDSLGSTRNRNHLI